MPQKTLCPKCHGQRMTSCLACRGMGKKSAAGIPLGSCNECGGTGRHRCDVCGGAGEVEPRRSQGEPRPLLADEVSNWQKSTAITGAMRWKYCSVSASCLRFGRPVVLGASYFNKNVKMSCPKSEGCHSSTDHGGGKRGARNLTILPIPAGVITHFVPHPQTWCSLVHTSRTFHRPLGPRLTAVKNALSEVLHLKDSVVRATARWFIQMRVNHFPDDYVMVTLLNDGDYPTFHRPRHVN